jgi:hypothetical protein
MLGYKKGNTKLLTGQIPRHYPADRVYLDGDPTKNVQDAVDKSQAMIATVQPNLTAVKAYAKGEQFVYQGLLYKATTAISSGGTITIGGNCELADSVMEQMIDFPFTVLADIAITSGATASIDKTGCKFLIAQLLTGTIVLQNLIFPVNYSASFELACFERENVYATVLVSLSNTAVTVTSSTSTGWSNLHVQIIGIK